MCDQEVESCDCVDEETECSDACVYGRVDVSVCVSATLMLKISQKLCDLRVHVH